MSCADDLIHMVGVETVCHLRISAGLVVTTPIVGVSIMSPEGLMVHATKYAELEQHRIRIGQAVLGLMQCVELSAAIEEVRAEMQTPTGDV